jgi:uncharacterized protein (TIGR03437 family)
MKTLGVALLMFAGSAMAQPAIGSVVNGVSFGPVMSPGCLISIFGTNLAANTVTAPSVPLATTLGATSVTIGGKAAPLYFVSANQINAQIPFEVTTATAVVVVTTGGVASTGLTIRLSSLSPALFSAASTGSGPGLYFDPNFKTITSALSPGSTIILYATGLGQTNPTAVTGAGGLSLQPAVTTPDVYIGEVKGTVSYAGLAPGFVGVYQLNVVVPNGVASTRMYLVQGGQTSNVTDVIIAAGANVKNVTGTISAVYPVSTTQATFSPLIIVPTFNVKFDIVPTAQKFTVVAVFEAGSSTITIDPVAGTYRAVASIPNTQTRQFSFAGSNITALDLLTGGAFPGNTVPFSRFDPAALSAMSSLPLPNGSSAFNATTAYAATGTAQAGTTFIVDSQNNTALSSFGAWLAVPYAPYLKNRGTTLRLFIDGKLISTATVSFTTP